jgi:hypothetical protein
VLNSLRSKETQIALPTKTNLKDNYAVPMTLSTKPEPGLNAWAIFNNVA